MSMPLRVTIYRLGAPVTACPLHVFEWRLDDEAADLARTAIYLLRPDAYVALAHPSGTLDALDRYL